MRTQPLLERRRQFRNGESSSFQRIGAQHTRAACVGEDRDASSRRQRLQSQLRRRLEQLGQRFGRDATRLQYGRARQGRGAGERRRMAARGAAARRRLSAEEDDERAMASDATRRRNESTRVLK